MAIKSLANVFDMSTSSINFILFFGYDSSVRFQSSLYARTYRLRRHKKLYYPAKSIEEPVYHKAISELLHVSYG